MASYHYHTTDDKYVNPRESVVRNDNMDPYKKAGERLAAAVEHYVYAAGESGYRDLDYLVFHIALYDGAKNGQPHYQTMEWSPEIGRQARERTMSEPEDRRTPQSARSYYVKSNQFPVPPGTVEDEPEVY